MIFQFRQWMLPFFVNSFKVKKCGWSLKAIPLARNHKSILNWCSPWIAMMEVYKVLEGIRFLRSNYQREKLKVYLSIPSILNGFSFQFGENNYTTIYHVYIVIIIMQLAISPIHPYLDCLNPNSINFPVGQLKAGWEELRADRLWTI